MILVIDNYDSFTFNLVQALEAAGARVTVVRNDAIDVEAVAAMADDPAADLRGIVISPGPGNPSDGGVSNEAILHFTGKIPVFGVCLGHQCLGAVYGGTVTRAPRLMHGKTSPIHHYGTGLFAGIPSPFEATRYHSLIVLEPVPDCLEVTAFTSEGEVMGLKHRAHPTFGVQFHPESILTKHGKQILKNFLQTN